MRTTSAGIPVFDFCPPQPARKIARPALAPMLGRLAFIGLVAGLFVSVPQAAALLQTPAVTHAAR